MFIKANLKKLIKYVIPPIILDGVRKLIQQPSNNVVEWEYVQEGWEAQKTDRKIKGWNVNSVLEAYKSSWPEFVQSLNDTTPLGSSKSIESVNSTYYDVISHNTRMSYAYVLGLCAAKNPTITMLDWGGGLGHYYLLSKALFPGLSIEYHCKDVPVITEYGRQLFPENHYYIDNSCFNRNYDLILASASLQYSQNWAGDLQTLANSTGNYIFITRLPVVLHSDSFVMVQRPYHYNYNTEYLGWCFNRQVFLEQAKLAGLELKREFILGDNIIIKGAPEECEYRGYLFKPKIVKEV